MRLACVTPTALQTENRRVSSHAVFQSTYRELPGNHLALSVTEAHYLQADTRRSPVKKPAYTT